MYLGSCHFSTVHLSSCKPNSLMDDSKGLNDCQHSAVHYETIHSVGSSGLATIKVHN